MEEQRTSKEPRECKAEGRVFQEEKSDQGLYQVYRPLERAHVKQELRVAFGQAAWRPLGTLTDWLTQ